MGKFKTDQNRHKSKLQLSTESKLFGKQPPKIPTTSNAFLLIISGCFHLSPINSRVSEGLSLKWNSEISNSSVGPCDTSHLSVDLGFKHHQSGFSVNMKLSHSLHNLSSWCCPWTSHTPPSPACRDVHKLNHTNKWWIKGTPSVQTAQGVHS